MGIRLKDLSKLGYRDNVARSLAVAIVGKHCKHQSKEQIIKTLSDVLKNPDTYKENETWGKLAEHLSPTLIEKKFTAYDLLDEPLPYKTYGSKFIETLAKQQMNLAMRLPVSVAGALMPDAHAGYGLPIGGVLATDNAVIPYAVGVDIGCRMSLTVFDAKADYLKRYSHQIKEALKNYTHFGMEGGLTFAQEHEVTEREEFRLTPLLRDLRGKAIRQLGSSGGGNHFVEFGELLLQEENMLGLPEGNYMALLSHSGSRGLGAAIAMHYSRIAREVCKLPREAQHFAWLDLNSEEGQEYWMSILGRRLCPCLSRTNPPEPLESSGTEANGEREQSSQLRLERGDCTRTHCHRASQRGYSCTGWATGTYPRKHGNSRLSGSRSGCGRVIMFRFARCRTGYVTPEGKGEFHPVGHEEISLAGRGHTDWRQHRRDAISLQEHRPGDAAPRDIGRSAGQIHAAHCKDE